MRVINLDDTGIKLLNDKKNQIYITKDDLVNFVAGQYTITEDQVLIFGENQLALSSEEIKDFPIILKYLKNEVLKQS